MSRKTGRLWIGIGAATLVGASASGALAQHSGSHGAAAAKGDGDATKSAPAGMQTGGMVAPKAGEAYLLDGGPRDSRIRIYRDIALMRGHLLVGDELIGQAAWDEALPHFLHPTEELYAIMGRYITAHKVTPFDKQLLAQGQAVKAKNKAAYQQAARVVDQRMTNALNTFKRFMQGQPFSSYTARTVAEVLKVAKAEYEASIEDGKIAKPVEYQDSRGFVWYVEKMLDAQAKDFAKIDAAKFAQLQAMLADLKRAWPTAIPPQRPVLTAAEVGAKIDAVAEAAQRFF